MAASHDPVEMVFHEVQDQTGKWVLFERTPFVGGELYIPLPVIPIGGGYTIAITKFMILEVIAALVILAIFIPLSKKIRDGGLPRGVFWNFFESILMFIRDEIARPNLDDPHPHHAHDDHGHGHGHDDPSHHHPNKTEDVPAAAFPVQEHAKHVGEKLLSPEHAGDKFVPFLWTLFMFILVTNLLGMIPFLGSPTASVWVTGALAVMVFIILHAVPTVARGHPLKYLASIYPHIDLGSNLGARIAGGILGFGIFCIELFGTAIKSFVLAVRLFANMFAGHMVLGIILMFVYTVGMLESAEGDPSYGLWGGVTLASVLGVVALSMLELFVAFLQAYVFTFLTALFLGMNLYPEH
jgi:F-type H+-transporting ATPase subunit a